MRATASTSVLFSPRRLFIAAGLAALVILVAATIASFSDESAVDYRNSIKDSISAVEAAVKLITGESSGGIDKAIAILERSGNLHSALKAGLSKLYAYSSDTGVLALDRFASLCD